MSTGFGLNAWLAIGEEVTYGTPVARTKWISILEESIAGKQNLISKPALNQVSQSNRVQSKKDVGGAFKFQVGFEGHEKILKHAMGSLAAVSGAGPYTHNFSLASALPTGLTIEVNRDSAAVGGSSAFLYEGCQVNKLVLSQQKEDFLTCEAEIVGEDFSLVALTAQSFTPFNGISWDMLSVATLNGANIKPQSFEITIENGLANDRFKLGQRTRLGLGRQQTRKVTGKMSIEFEQLTEHALFLAQTTLVPLVLTYNNTLGGANNKQFTMNFPTVAIQGDQPKATGQGALMMDLVFEAYQNAAANDEMTATLINSTNTTQ